MGLLSLCADRAGLVSAECAAFASSIAGPKPAKILEVDETNPMPNYLELPLGAKAPEIVNAIIEIPYEGKMKYEYDKQLHVFKLDRNLYSPVHYPGDYGFLPSTLGDDNDPLDVLVLVDEPSFPGCLQQVRPIGLMDMIDGGEGDEKILAVGCGNPRYFDINSYQQIHPHKLKEIVQFFSTYKELEGKKVEVKGWRDVQYAHEVIHKSVQAYQAKNAK